MFKAVLFVCAQALFIQSIAGQCGRYAAAPLAAYGAGPCADAYGIAGPLAGPCGGAYGIAGPLAGPYGGAYAYDAAIVPASNGGGLGVSSASAIPPSGVSVYSENAIAGDLAVGGALPFLGTVALEGVLPTAGAGAVNYGCGNGAVAIVAEEAGPAGIAGPFGAYGAYGAGPYAAGPLGAGYGAYGYGIGGLAGPYGAGCGCGAALI